MLKQFDLGLESKAFKKELEVLAKIKLSEDFESSRLGLPEMMGFAYGLQQSRAELLISHCGRDLNKEWLSYMENISLTSQAEFKVKIMQMAI